MDEHRLLRIVLYLHHRLERAQRNGEGTLSLSQYRLLYMIQQGPARSVELAMASGMTKPSIGALVGQLESEGLIKRKALEADRRAASIQITAKGRKAVAAFERLLQIELERFLGEAAVERADGELNWLFDLMQERRDQAHADWALRVESVGREGSGQN